MSSTAEARDSQTPARAPAAASGAGGSGGAEQTTDSAVGDPASAPAMPRRYAVLIGNVADAAPGSAAEASATSQLHDALSQLRMAIAEEADVLATTGGDSGGADVFERPGKQTPEEHQRVVDATAPPCVSALLGVLRAGNDDARFSACLALGELLCCDLVLGRASAVAAVAASADGVRVIVRVIASGKGTVGGVIEGEDAPSDHDTTDEDEADDLAEGAVDEELRTLTKGVACFALASLLDAAYFGREGTAAHVSALAKRASAANATIAVTRLLHSGLPDAMKHNAFILLGHLALVDLVAGEELVTLGGVPHIAALIQEKSPPWVTLACLRALSAICTMKPEKDGAEAADVAQAARAALRMCSFDMTFVDELADEQSGAARRHFDGLGVTDAVVVAAGALSDEMRADNSSHSNTEGGADAASQWSSNGLTVIIAVVVVAIAASWFLGNGDDTESV